VDFPLFLYLCYHSFRYSLSHRRSYFRWPTQGTVLPTTTLRTTGRTTMMPTHRYPLHLLLRKCWLYKHKCYRPCSRPWSIYSMLNPRHHHLRRGIGLEISNTLSRRPSLMLWSRWTLMIGSSLWRRSCKWCNATIMGG
jgi:hypothetical protein